MKNAIANLLCFIGWAAVGIHVYQGYGWEHPLGIIGFVIAGVGHAIKAGFAGADTLHGKQSERKAQ